MGSMAPSSRRLTARGTGRSCGPLCQGRSVARRPGPAGSAVLLLSQPLSGRLCRDPLLADAYAGFRDFHDANRKPGPIRDRQFESAFLQRRICKLSVPKHRAKCGLRTQPPPSRPTSRCRRLYGLPCSGDFAPGRGGLLQLLSMSLSPCRRFHPAEVNSRIGQCSAAHAVFALRR